MAYKYGYVEGGAAPVGGADPLDAFVASQSGPAVDPLDAFVASSGGVSRTAMPVAQPAPPPQRSAFDELSRQIGLTARAGATGLASLPTMAGDALNTGINAVTGGINSVFGANIPQFQMPSEALARGLTAAGLPQPEGATERVVQDVASGLAGAGSQFRLGQALMNVPAANWVGAMMTTAPGAQILGTAGGAGAAGATREAGGGELSQLGAGIAGSLAPAIGASLLTRALANRTLPIAPARVEPTLGGPEPAFNIDISGTNAPTPAQLAAGLAANEPSVSVVAGARPTNVAPTASQLGTALAANEPTIGGSRLGTAVAANEPTVGVSQVPVRSANRPAVEQAAPIAEPEPFTVPALPAPKTSLPIEDQQSNIDTMRKIGLESQRPSAITGDKFTAGQEFQQAKLDTPQGEVVRNQLQNEQTTLKAYAENIVADTGATAGSPEAVGQATRAPLRGLFDHIKAKVAALYQAADANSQGLPSVQADEFSSFMGTKSNFAGSSEKSHLGRAIRLYLKEQDLINPDGSMKPMTVKQSEQLRQRINEEWNPQNSGLIGKITEALDNDVTKTGGGDLYDQARALHKYRKDTLDNPNGISSLLQEEGPGGINQLVPDEKVGAKLLGMPTNQLRHIIETLKSVPDELRPLADQAIAEIKGIFAERIRLAGDKGGTQAGPSMWNAADVTRELNKQNSKLTLIFSPEEMDSFHTLNRAGHILQTPSAYPGAAVQGHNLAQRGMIFAPTAAATALGSHFGPLGAAGGAALGAALSKKTATAIDRRMAEKLAEQLLNPKTLTPNP